MTAETSTWAGGPLVPPDYVIGHFALLVMRPGLAPIPVHDLRHGASTLASASGG